jgi:PLP dependent protein
MIPFRIKVTFNGTLNFNNDRFIYMGQPIHQRYREILNRIDAACKNAGRDPSEITLVAVSKTKPDSDVFELLKTGHKHIGENRAKALEDRMTSIKDDSVQWHFIGNLQTNKIKYMAHRVDWIQSVHKKKALKEIEKRAKDEGRVINALIQVNISGEGQKSGCEPDQLEPILKYARNLDHTRVKGLMGMATFTDDPEKVRPEFRMLKKLRDEHLHLTGGAVELEHLSMGMTNDLEVAIEEGSTMVRVGTAIFGERNY